MLQPFHTLWRDQTCTISQVPHKQEVFPHLFRQTSHATQLRHKIDETVFSRPEMNLLSQWYQHWLWHVPYFHLIFLRKTDYSLRKGFKASFLGSTSNEGGWIQIFLYIFPYKTCKSKLWHHKIKYFIKTFNFCLKYFPFV